MKAKSQTTRNEYRKLSDQELLYRYIHRREQGAILCLFEKYGHLIYAVCRSYLGGPAAAGAAVQAIFIGMLDRISSDPVSDVKNWLFDAARTYCIAVMRDMGSGAVLPEGAAEPDCDLVYTGKDRETRLEEAMSRLDQEQRNYITRFYGDRRTFEEIAEATGGDPARIAGHIREGRKRLKQHLETQNEAAP